MIPVVPESKLTSSIPGKAECKDIVKLKNSSAEINKTELNQEHEIPFQIEVFVCCYSIECIDLLLGISGKNCLKHSREK